MRLRSESGVTLVEIIVVIVIIGVLWALALPAGHSLVKGQLIQTVHNACQIQQIAMSAALDRNVTGDTNTSWPGKDTSFAVWVRSLTNAKGTNWTITESTIAKLFSAPGVRLEHFPEYTEGKTAFRVYAVSANSTPDTVFLTTYNWNAEAPGALSPESVPYGDKGFVVVHMGGDAVTYSAKHATNNPEFFGTLTKNVKP